MFSTTRLSLCTLLVLFSFFAFFGLSIDALAEIRISHDETHINVEASNLDCKLPEKREAFLEIANKFAAMISSLQEKFKGTPWEELSEISQDEIHSRIEAAITDFYATQQQIEAAPTREFGNPNFPKTDRMPTSFPSFLGIGSGITDFFQKARPQAMYVTIALNLTNTQKYSAQEVASLEKAIKDAASGNKMKALVDVNGGITVQIGLVAVPTCMWYAAKAPATEKNPNLALEPTLPVSDPKTALLDKLGTDSSRAVLNKRIAEQEKKLTESTGKMIEGWYSPPTNWVIRPIMFTYVRGGVGKELEKSSKWWQRISGGFVFGNINRVTDLVGYFIAGSGDIGFDVGSFQPGFNWKAGCITNPQLEKTIPYCGNFIFTNFRWDPKDLGQNNINFHYNVKGEFGVVVTGPVAVRTLLSSASFPPEEIDSTIQDLGWLLGENDEHNLRVKNAKK